LSIELLEAFVMVAKTGNVTLAGTKLNRTQPCISTQIKRLEERVGKPLIERNSRTIHLTPTGRVLFENAENILQCYETALLRLSVPELTGELHVGLPEWFATDRLQSVFCDFVRAHPNVKLDITIADSVTLHERLTEGDINLAIALSSHHRTEPDNFVEEPLVWVANQREQISDVVPLVLFEKPCPFRERVFDALRSAGRHWQERMATSSVAVAQVAVSSGVGVSALPAGAVLPNHKVLTEADGFPPLPSVNLAVYTPSGEPSQTLISFSKHLNEFLRDSVSQKSALSRHNELQNTVRNSHKINKLPHQNGLGSLLGDGKLSDELHLVETRTPN
jgi:DNA-binding transcriptional LysR family regulator